VKLTQWPPGLFYAGHSGARFSASDLPKLRALRDAYRQLIASARALQASERDPVALLAGVSVISDLEAKYTACGQALDIIERTPARWRP
jgi:hypothetical protein